MPAVIVTGADSGIGKATAIAFAEGGYDVGFTFLEHPAGAQGTADRVRNAGRHVEMLPMDLSDPSTGAAVVNELADGLNGIDVLVSNAATAFRAPFLETGLQDWQHVLAVNVTGAFICMQTAARRMVESRTPGRIIAVSSIQQVFPHPGSAAYGAAKGALGQLVRVMALELGPHHITVNAVAPGEIATAMSGMEGVDPATVPRPNVPLGRPGDPREIASLIVWLASRDAAYATGATFVIDGGATLIAPALAGAVSTVGQSDKDDGGAG